VTDRMLIQFRKAEASDAPALSELAFRSKAHWGYAPAQLETWRADLTLSPSWISLHPTYVAEIGGQIAGFFALLAEHGSWKLEHLWVAPEAMGQGVGRSMLAHAVIIAKQVGASELIIDSDPNAEGFYRANGAVWTGSIPAPIEGAPQREIPVLRLAIQ
jgi:GNAT superfamily N-acetyltransferase